MQIPFQTKGGEASAQSILAFVKTLKISNISDTMPCNPAKVK
jgi:hypothetical protein